jgi:hypothetical protein
MPEENDVTEETAEGQAPKETVTEETPDTVDESTGTEVESTDSEDVASLPEWAQKQIQRLRAENGRDRTAAKEKAAAEARAAAQAGAEAAREKAVADALAAHNARLAKALGLTAEEEQELTPEQVLEKVTRERDEERTAREERDRQFRDLSLEVAVQDAATMHSARADRLLDSRAFMRTVKDIDPAGDGYRVAVAEAVAKAVEADASLKAPEQSSAAKVSGGTTVAGVKPKRREDMTIDELRQEKIHRRS